MNASDHTSLVNSPPKRSAPGFKLHDRQLMDVFAILVILLRLESRSKSKGSVFRKLHPFTFSPEEAVKAMTTLSIDIELQVVTTTVAYSIEADLGFSLLHKFFEAHLLHDPSSRTTCQMKHNTQLQITPKGAAMVYNFCKSIGMRRDKMPGVVKGEFNTMSLFQFHRSGTTNKILYSEYLLYILVWKMMGKKPNVWSPAQTPGPANNMFEHENVLDVSMHGSITTPKVSPFYHKYFSNPESDAHIQYYECCSGLRLFESRTFNLKDRTVIVRNCFSGKALIQWLLDCSNLQSLSEAVEIGFLMVKHYLLVPVNDDYVHFLPDRNAFYTLSEAAERACMWHADSSDSLSLSPEETEVRDSVVEHENDNLMAMVLDPGMRYLFKLHLEKERCSENIDAYLQLSEFLNAKGQLSQLLKQYNGSVGSRREKLAKRCERLATTHYSMAYHIFSTYLDEQSRYNLNISFGLRQEVRDVMKRLCFGVDEALPDYNVTAYLRTPVDGSFEHATKPKRSDDNSTLALLESLEEIFRIFEKVKRSIYRLMEADSFPKFIKSDEYIYAIGLKAHCEGKVETSSNERESQN